MHTLYIHTYTLYTKQFYLNTYPIFYSITGKPYIAVYICTHAHTNMHKSK